MTWGGGGHIEGEMGGERWSSGRTYGKVRGGEEGMEVRLERRRRAWDNENYMYGRRRNDGVKQRVVCNRGGGADGDC